MPAKNGPQGSHFPSHRERNQEKKLPNLDDEFAKDLGLASLEELKQKVRENLQKNKSPDPKKEVEEQIYQSLVDNHKFSIPRRSWMNACAP